MLVTKKMLLALTLIGALVGAGVGSLITHSAASSSSTPNTSYETAKTSNTQPAYTQTAYTQKTADQIEAERISQFNTTLEQTAYRQGFDEGYAACAGESNRTTTKSSAAPVSYRTQASRSSNNRRVYYDYGTAPRGRTFWQKHRDKLTLAMGTGGGALVGGLIGGKKGAGIGALAGLGSSALYTYKIRKRNRNY